MGHRVRVMAVVEGYVVARIVGCVPYLVPEGDFVRDHYPLAPLKCNRCGNTPKAVAEPGDECARDGCYGHLHTPEEGTSQ